jgi:hypothetical protein
LITRRLKGLKTWIFPEDARNSRCLTDEMHCVHNGAVGKEPSTKLIHLLNRLEPEDDWIDRPLGPQRVVERNRSRDHRRGDFGEVEPRSDDKYLKYIAYFNDAGMRAVTAAGRVVAGVAFRPYTLV